MSRKRWIWVGMLAGVLVAVGAGAWALRGQVAYAHIATAYAAKQTCSCLHVSGRAVDSCLADFPPEARGNVDVTLEGDTVHASVLFGTIAAEAAYEDGYGCSIIAR